MPSGIYKRKLKYNISKRFLLQEYIISKKSTHQIAKEISCSHKTILNYLYRFNIPVRPKKEVFNFKGRKHTKKTKEYMRKAHYKGGLSDKAKQNQKSYQKEWVKKNKNRVREYDRKYKKKLRKNKEYRKKQSIYFKKKYKNNAHYRIRQCISSIIRKRLQKRLSGKKGQSINKYLPFTIDTLIIHLQRQFRKGMTWNNYGKVWQIDHIIPDCRFKYKNM